MSQAQIQPLRIQKTPLSTQRMSNTPIHRPLAEISPSERRRNSPSYSQLTKKPILHPESSPLDSSPFTNSPRLYWQSKDPGSPTRGNAENQDPRDNSVSPAKRSSIENLKRASRVKNSSMFAREQKNEYDPTSSPKVERPLSNGRPLSSQALRADGISKSAKAFAGNDPHKALQSPQKPTGRASMPLSMSSPIKDLNSPTKSSLSSKSRYGPAQAFDPDSGIWSDDEDSLVERRLPPGKSLHRHAKSVTFDVAPPQVNEYEQATPDPSSVASGSREGSHDSYDDEDESFDRGSSMDRDDSFDASLEDTEKTPVVLPEDWRFMSPDIANDELTVRFDDPFNGDRSSPALTTLPSSALDARASPVRTESADSSGDRRPLPPLPPNGSAKAAHARSDSKDSLPVAERLDHLQRQATSPPRPASVSKSDIQSMSGCSMTLEERLRLMMLDDKDSAKDPAAEQRERKLRRGSPTRSMNHEAMQQKPEVEEIDDLDDLADLDDYRLPPRISRESILRNVRDRVNQDKVKEASPIEELGSGLSQDLSNIHPDIPLPSTEEVDADGASVKQEAVETDADLYAIPDLYQQHLQAESFANAMQKLEAIKQAQESDHHDMPLADRDEDEESLYSVDSKSAMPSLEHGAPDSDGQGPPTPKGPIAGPTTTSGDRKDAHRMSLPQFAALLGENDFDFGMSSFISEAETQGGQRGAIEVSAGSASYQYSADAKDHAQPPSELPRPKTPEAQSYGYMDEITDLSPEFSTPDSVVRHPVRDSPHADSPGVPEPAATVKASSGKLKIRQSATPADLKAMAEVRRQLSGEAPPVPTIPAEHIARPESQNDNLNDEASGTKDPVDAERNKRKSSLTPLDLQVGKDGGLGIESEFDRLIEAQKVESPSREYSSLKPPWSPGNQDHIGRSNPQAVKERGANGSFRTQKGYLMRQNTKVIVASSASHENAETNPDTQDETTPGMRGTRSAGNSPRKPSTTQSWTTEPWNGKIRRKSIRRSGGIPSKAPTGQAPPLPGQQSNVTSGLDSVDENETMDGPDEIGEDGERGRLFVKVVRVKELDLPLPRGERSYFALTLDNGLHCVTTSWLELGKTAPIGQEFELVVLNDLEFQLTLQTQIEEPKTKAVVESPTKTQKAAKSSAFSRVFASPRKRKEMELRQQEEAERAERQRQHDWQASRRSMQPTAWDLQHKLVAQDGSFARAYVCLKDHESSAYGKAVTVDIPCFNEWATEEAANGSSARSKRTGGIMRKPPYRIGKLELQLFYVPKPKDAPEEDMPKSMSACIRDLKEAQQAGPTKWEGHLSQQGGDCPYWRRRYFSLNGSKFTAYHESTRQPRATINLAKASKLIDDKSSLMKPGKNNRRRSAFAEEEEGYMFVEEGFRMRFGNGETIDFYADSAADKDAWMKALSEVVGKDMKKKKWTDLVIEKHRAVSTRAQQAMDGKIRPASPSKPVGPASPTKAAPHVNKSAPPTPAKNFAPRQPPLAVPEKSPRRSDVGGVASRRAEMASKTRSMIF